MCARIRTSSQSLVQRLVSFEIHALSFLSFIGSIAEPDAVRQARAYDERQNGENSWPLCGVRSMILSPPALIEYMEGMEALPVVDRKSARVCIVSSCVSLSSSPTALGPSPVCVPPVLQRGLSVLCPLCFVSPVLRGPMLPIPLLPLSLVSNVLSPCGRDTHLA